MKCKILIFALFVSCLANAQLSHGIIGENNWFNGWTSFKPKTIGYKEPTEILVGTISENKTLTKRNTYIIMGTVYITKGTVLTIEPGTVIKGDSDSNGTLMIVKGAKIIAEGTDTDPIIFTSNKSTTERKPGDWGGIILMGEAPINKFGGVASSFYDPNPEYNSYGGVDENSNSGVLKYVRIEFAGRKIRPQMNLNGLTLAAVGLKTKIENVQVSFSGDDSFEVIGGTVNFNNVISYRANDDDFDYSQGTISTVNNSAIIRYPYAADATRSRCFEIDSYDKFENYDQARRKTVVKLNNVTMVNNEINNQGLVKEAISLKSDSFLEMDKCVVAGFSSFIALDDKYISGDNFKKIKIKNSTIDSCNELFTYETLQNAVDVSEWFKKIDKALIIDNIGINNLFKNNDIKKTPDFRLK